MLNPNDQEIRCYIDSLLHITKDGLAPPTLKSYHKPDINHMQDIRADLANCTHDFSQEIFKNDKALLEGLDVHYWLHLLQHQARKGRIQLAPQAQKHMDTIRELRHKWAHQEVITCEQAQAAADASHKLLTMLKASKEAGYVQDAIKQLVLIATDANGDTELVHPIKEASTYYIQIVEHNGLTVGQNIPVQKERVLIGRSLNSDIRIVHDPRVSRAHLLVTRQSDDIRLTDLRSANGTKIEDNDLPPNKSITWSPGSRIVIGNTWLILRRGS